MKEQIEGVIKFSRSTGPRAKECTCCEGRHVFGISINVKRRKNRVFAGLHIENVDDWLDEQLSLHKDEIENKKVVVIIETVD
jgi:hypothetical protein